MRDPRTIGRARALAFLASLNANPDAAVAEAREAANRRRERKERADEIRRLRRGLRPDLIPPPGQKRCTNCRTPKPLSAFPKHDKSRDGKGSHCNDCCREATRRRTGAKPRVPDLPWREIAIAWRDDPRATFTGLADRYGTTRPWIRRAIANELTPYERREARKTKQIGRWCGARSAA